MTAQQQSQFAAVFGFPCPEDEQRDWLKEFYLWKNGDALGFGSVAIRLFERWSSDLHRL